MQYRKKILRVSDNRFSLETANGMYLHYLEMACLQIMIGKVFWVIDCVIMAGLMHNFLQKLLFILINEYYQ